MLQPTLLILNGVLEIQRFFFSYLDHFYLNKIMPKESYLVASLRPQFKHKL